MNKESSSIAKAIILEVIEHQLRDNDPPETRLTLDRLVSDGYTEREAMELIASALTAQIFHMLKEDRPYNEAEYVQALRNLPHLPEE